MDGGTDGQKDGRRDGRTEEQTDGRTDRQTDRQTDNESASHRHLREKRRQVGAAAIVGSAADVKAAGGGVKEGKAVTDGRATGRGVHHLFLVQRHEVHRISTCGETIRSASGGAQQSAKPSAKLSGRDRAGRAPSAA
jgi:hypothetical protein